ncbi:hypothetical protein FHR32_003636 [Streptosporangium album]|uniref:Uncharacterized protein n=1 Tax=Streptosporangium album TaxID=47479 RepID=A0A7W7W9W0_9ACTN|nr:hypothetical protein [Streptosporangium album]MBB4939331.1 hypothetical protein [Streptosporangium album]
MKNSPAALALPALVAVPVPVAQAAAAPQFSYGEASMPPAAAPTWTASTRPALPTQPR